ncbi:glycosyltransferase family 2 protein [Saccharopolyspora gloriosae]|uniref:Glycosyltransferase involved in cell wall biosynthesis n=1 Tax=Saccharopolyspora gloriosae TaxID=455344 RepID=A0A840NL07_9PSEU|nr:glycosyltransferase family 2 protein [Saccharopolyspora gloriosae]MBB5070705.1 glycosyltransferase involved in cell wall biosynthesis [Saccharopolyspora gloriosae]
MDLTVVVPCFNEQDGIPRLHAELLRVLPGVAPDYEVVAVDDGSTDRTLPRLRELAASDPRFRYLSLSRNFGKEAAVLAGLRRAHGRRVVIMDADLQHPPELLGRMLAVLDSGHDQVVACRDRSGEPLSRRLPARFFYRLLNRFCEVRVPDGAGDFRMLTRRAVQALLALPEQHRFSKGLFAWIGFDTAHVPFRGGARQGGRSRWTWRALVEHGADGLFSFHRKPLRGAGCVGALVATAGAVQALRELAGGGPLLAPVLLCAAGVQMLLLGVVGEYLGRIHLETMGRPHFLVKESGGLARGIGGSAGDRGYDALCAASAERV